MNGKIECVCRIAGVELAQVVAVDFQPDDIILAVRGIGRVRVERSSLPAEIEALPDNPDEAAPQPDQAVAQPAPGLKRATKRRK